MQKDAKSSASAQSEHASRSHQAGRYSGRRNRLRRSHILRGYASFTRVLSGGQSLSVPPIRLFFRPLPQTSSGTTIGFAVSRSFRSAAKRNRVRRLMREAYRLHQDLWGDEASVSIEAVVMYTGRVDNIPQFTAIESAIKTLMMKVAKRTA